MKSEKKTKDNSASLETALSVLGVLEKTARDKNKKSIHRPAKPTAEPDFPTTAATLAIAQTQCKAERKRKKRK